jgi:hypothetical protein
MNEASNQDSILLMELRSISERSAAVSRFENPPPPAAAAVVAAAAASISATFLLNQTQNYHGQQQDPRHDMMTIPSRDFDPADTASSSAQEVLLSKKSDSDQKNKTQLLFDTNFSCDVDRKCLRHDQEGQVEALGEIRDHYASSSFSSEKEESLLGSHAKQFLSRNPEKSNFNQYWYSAETIETLCQAILELLGKGPSLDRKSVAFLSTPSLYFAVAPATITGKIECKLFDVSNN